MSFLLLIGGCWVVTTAPRFVLVESFQYHRKAVSVARNEGATFGSEQRISSISSSSTKLSAHYLTTALEGLWGKRLLETQWTDQTAKNSSSDTETVNNDYRCLSWLNLESKDDFDSDQTNSSEQHDTTLPLYPLSEVYLPSGGGSFAVNHTLNNVEPQNIQMALDLLESSSSPRFCVVLRTMDTGRIASVGNIFKIIDADIQKMPASTPEEEEEESIARIRLACQSEGLVFIRGIENGSSWKSNRLMQSKEYLKAKVKHQKAADSDVGFNWIDTYNTIREDLRTIKVIYQLQLGAEEYPPGTLLRLGDEIRDFPELNEDDASHTPDALLWDLAGEWQSVCMTLRQGTQAILATDRNEKMVAAVCANGGPLKLPIHLSDLDPEARKKVQQLDQTAQEKHEVSGMDPVLDFQVLIALPTTERRFDFLARLVKRERLRLENIASTYSSSSRSR